MGTWGIGPFECDEALDQVWDVIEVTGLGGVRTRMGFFIAQSDRGALGFEAADVQAACALCEVVAACLGAPSPAAPPALVSWARGGVSAITEEDRAQALHLAGRLRLAARFFSMVDDDPTDPTSKFGQMITDIEDRLRFRAAG